MIFSFRNKLLKKYNNIFEVLSAGQYKHFPYLNEQKAGILVLSADKYEHFPYLNEQKAGILVLFADKYEYFPYLNE